MILTALLLFTMTGCGDNADTKPSDAPKTESNEPIWAQGKQTDGQLFQGLNLDGVGNADDEAYVSICQYGEYDEMVTILRIHLGTGETLANIFPVHGAINF